MKKLIAIAVAVPVITLLGGCLNPKANASAPKPAHIVFVGFDGWGSAYTDDTLKLPNLRRLMDVGSWTMDKKSVLPSSSAVNWASIFMAAGPEQHGYIAWNTTKSVFPPLYTLASGRFPDVYALCRDAEPQAKLGVVYEWDGIASIIDTNVCDFVCQSNQCAEAGIAFLKAQKPRIMTFIYDSPDHQGHGQGWGSDAYKRAIEDMDVNLGKILKAIDEAGMADDTVVIVTSDHGGSDRGHGKATVADMTSPLIICGRGIRRNHHLESPVYAYDIGATMVRLLGIDLPRICTGRAIDEALMSAQSTRR